MNIRKTNLRDAIVFHMINLISDFEEILNEEGLESEYWMFYQFHVRNLFYRSSLNLSKAKHIISVLKNENK